MRGDVVAGRKLALEALGQHPPDELRVLPTHLIEGLGQHSVEPLGGGPGLLGREHLAQHGDDGTLLGQGCDVCGRPLEHDDVGGGPRQRGDECDGGCPTADDHDPLAGVVEAFGPGLRVHDDAAEVSHAFEVRQIPVVVAVIATTGEEARGRDLDGLSGVGPLGGDVPDRVGCRPLGRDDPVVEANMALDAGLARCVFDVLQNGVAVSD